LAAIVALGAIQNIVFNIGNANEALSPVIWFSEVLYDLQAALCKTGRLSKRKTGLTFVPFSKTSELFWWFQGINITTGTVTGM